MVLTEKTPIQPAAATAEIDRRPCHVEHYTRKADGIWEFSEIDDCGGELAIPTLELAIPLAEIYAKVELLEPEPEDEYPEMP